MKRLKAFIPALMLAFITPALGQTPSAFRVLLGVNDDVPTRWDGTLKITGAGQYTVEPWRFEGDDKIDGDQFHLSTHVARFFYKVPDGDLPVANGFILRAASTEDASEFSFTTPQGAFSFRPSEVPYGQGIYKLDGRVYVDRVPAAIRLTDTPEEEDYPTLAAGASGDAWLAYVQFHHSRDAGKIRANPPSMPRDFSIYAEPTGGDQIWARRYSNGAWGQDIAITPAGEDCYKVAVAVDGGGRAWVVWSQNHSGNFDIYARPVDSSGPGAQMQISSEPGADVDPVAATDSSGNVWVAWQGWRNGIAAIYAAHQEGSGFSKPVKVSNSSADEWDPAIATDNSGRVAIAWDSYRNGNFDVYARIRSESTWGAEIPVAATPLYEAYPSLAYDPTGRLWIAYEEGARNWGKDWGAYDTSGVSVYQGRLTKLRGLQPDGSFVNLASPVDSALVGVPNLRADRLGSQASAALESLNLNPDFRSYRLGAEEPRWFPTVVRNSLPRLAVDASGRIWLAFRTPHPMWFGSLGTSWQEYLVSFDGKAWMKPVYLDHTDNLLDNRPALAAISGGRLLIVSSSDGRREPKTPFTHNSYLRSANDPYNDDLWSSEVDLGPATQPPPVAATQPEPAPANTIDQRRTVAIQAIHAYRGGPGGNLRIVRGEFHRHSELSVDGSDDGSLFDQYRYVRDAVGLDWVGCCDHDNGDGREYTWWITQKLTDVFYAPGKFSPMFSYERSVNYPDGHRNVIFAQRGIHVLPRLDPLHLADAAEAARYEPTPDTRMLYAYLKQFDGVAGSHTSATGMGTDWRDNDPNAEPVVEIYQGLRQDYEMPGAPRSSSEHDAIGGWRPKGFVNLALDKGYRLGFEASSDHISTHMSYANLYVTNLTRQAVLDALKKRHVYAATDEILADVECGDHMMGDEFSTAEAPTFRIKLRGLSKFSKVTIIRSGKIVYSTSPRTQDVELSWRDNQPVRNQTSYYYVRGEEENGEIVWVSPMWIKFTGP